MAAVPTFTEGVACHHADLQFLLSPPSLDCYQNTQQAVLTTGVTTLVTFDTNVYDTDSAGATHSTSSQTSRIKPLTAGYHLVVATVAFAAGATGIRFADLRQNAAGVSTGGTRQGLDLRNASSTLQTICVVTATVLFNGTTDYVEVFAQHTQGTNLGLYSANQASSWAGSVGIQTRWLNS